MRKYLFVSMTLIAILAIAMAVAVLSEDAGAFPGGGWQTACGDCHNGGSGGTAPPAHTVPAHSGIMGDCANCHTTAPAIDLSLCLECHGTADEVATVHGEQGCGGTGCHTIAQVTTTTAGGATTTSVTVPPTTGTTGTTTVTPTVTAPPTTTGPTTVSPTTTSTTTPTGAVDFTG